MHEKRKKYYHIRKDLFWCTILLAVTFLIGYAIHQHHGIFRFLCVSASIRNPKCFSFSMIILSISISTY